MRSKLKYFTPLLATGAVAAAIAAAPTAAAASNAGPSCVTLGPSSTQCQASGNVQINDSPPVHFQPQYPYLNGLGPYHHGHPHGR